jgi:O-antigen/teichoic acid export membrane protein
MPTMAHLRRKSHHQFREVVCKSRKYILSVALVAVANMILLAPAIFYVLYDRRYHEAGLIARWLGFGLWFTLLQRTSQASLLALGHSRALALANATNFLVTIISAPIGFHFLGMEGFILGWTLGNFVAVIIVDSALAKDGMPLLRQDAILTAGLIFFVAIGFWVRYALQLNDVWTAHAWRMKLLLSAVLTIVSAAIIYWEYRRSSGAHSGALNIEMNGMVIGQLEGTAGILSNGAANGVNGRPVNEVSCRD